jgi:hypothetical protein
MAKGLDSFVTSLETAADDIGNVPHHELAVLLRRAALRLRNTDIPLDPVADDYLTSTAAEMRMTRSDLARKIINDWLEANTYMVTDLESQVVDLMDEMRTDGTDGVA